MSSAVAEATHFPEAGIAEGQARVVENGVNVLQTDATEVLNWTLTVDPPPARLCGSIEVELRYRGRSSPIPAEDPWAG